ncbi:hypothetical protein [Exiguobacterium sp. RIT594]|uniref:hypothetical protein n=1 Tax=Exiguobacterium sp. RIT594 TaxID=2282449 RepID=UPI0013147B85|nr:hypothetical protein [Exiguobacterium sp. RIT594]
MSKLSAGQDRPLKTSVENAQATFGEESPADRLWVYLGSTWKYLSEDLPHHLP